MADATVKDLEALRQSRLQRMRVQLKQLRTKEALQACLDRPGGLSNDEKERLQKYISETLPVENEVDGMLIADVLRPLRQESGAQGGRRRERYINPRELVDDEDLDDIYDIAGSAGGANVQRVVEGLITGLGGAAGILATGSHLYNRYYGDNQEGKKEGKNDASTQGMTKAFGVLVNHLTSYVSHSLIELGEQNVASLVPSQPITRTTDDVEQLTTKLANIKAKFDEGLQRLKEKNKLLVAEAAALARAPETEVSVLTGKLQVAEQNFEKTKATLQERNAANQVLQQNVETLRAEANDNERKHNQLTAQLRTDVKAVEAIKAQQETQISGLEKALEGAQRRNDDLQTLIETFSKET